MSREWPVIPCSSQKLAMEAAGFEFSSTTNHPNDGVHWRGHGITLELPETHAIESVQVAITIAVIEAIATGERRARNNFRLALGFPPLSP